MHYRIITRVTVYDDRDYHWLFCVSFTTFHSPAVQYTVGCCCVPILYIFLSEIARGFVLMISKWCPVTYICLHLGFVNVTANKTGVAYGWKSANT